MKISEVKYNLEHKVRYKRVEYILSACILRYDKKNAQFYYRAELRDLKANAVVIVDLEEVQKP